MSKDNDFRHRHQNDGRPAQLLLITVGNVRSRDLLELIATHHDQVVQAFETVGFIELDKTSMTMHPRHPESNA